MHYGKKKHHVTGRLGSEIKAAEHHLKAEAKTGYRKFHHIEKVAVERATRGKRYV